MNEREAHDCSGGGDEMYTLGINAVYHDPAACLVQDGQVIAAAEE